MLDLYDRNQHYSVADRLFSEYDNEVQMENDNAN